MTAASTQAWPSRVGGYVLLAVALAVLFAFFKRLDVEPLLEVNTERAIPLIARLERAEQARGFPPHKRFLRPLALPGRENVDDPGIPFAMPMNGEVVFPDVPVHANARLRVGYGFERIQNGEGVTVDFSISVRPPDRGEPTEILRRSVRAPAVGSPPLHEWAEVGFDPGLFGSRVDVVFRTSCPVTLPDGDLIPVFLSPTISSDGLPRRLEDVVHTFEEVTDDLLARYEDAIESDDEPLTLTVSTTEQTCFAVRRDSDGTETLLPIETTALDGGMETDPTPFAERGGAWPAIVFGWDGTVVRYDVDVPDSGDPRLEFSIGVDHRAIGVGSATFSVVVDGEERFRETLDPERNPDHRGWHERSVDLSGAAGSRVRMEFAGEVTKRSLRTIRLEDHPPVGDPVPYELEVHRVRAGFARPRVVRDVAVRPRHSKRGSRRSVILVNVETLRADAIGCYGGPEGISPAIDRLASDGTRIEQCVTASSWTAPSVASLLTGLYPQTHGVTAHHRMFLADAVDTLAERARRDGVATFAFVTNTLITERRNFDQGFDEFLFCSEANARQAVAAFEDWLQNHRELQFFAYLHLFEPHDPCDAPGADRERYVPDELKGMDSRAALSRIIQGMLEGRSPTPDDADVRLLRGRYLGEVRYLDRQIERLRRAVESAGLLGRVVIVLTADHGEEFAEHGQVGHGSQLFGESVLVPLILFGDGVPRGRVLRGPVENRALFGLVLDLMGVPRDRSNEPSIDLHQENAGGRAYAMTEAGIRRVDPPDLLTKSIHLVRTRSASLHHTPRGRLVAPDGRILDVFPPETRLFLLDDDPGERHDRFSERPPELAELKTLMRAAFRNAVGRFSGLAAGSLDRAALRQIGYTAGSPVEEDELFDEDP